MRFIIDVRYFVSGEELCMSELEAASLGKSLPQLIGDYTRDYLRCTGVKE